MSDLNVPAGTPQTADATHEELERGFYSDELNKLSDPVSNEACKFALRYRFALTADLLIRQPYGLVLLSKYLSSKKTKAITEKLFANELLKVLDGSCTVNVEALRKKLSMVHTGLRTSKTLVVSNWISRDETLQTRKTELVTILKYLKHDANVVRKLIAEDAVSKFLEVHQTGNIEEADEASRGVFKRIIEEARDFMLLFFGESFHKKFDLPDDPTHRLFNFTEANTSDESQPIVEDFDSLATTGTEIQSRFQAFKVSSFQNNCVFQALSLCLTNFTDPSHDMQLRARTLWQLIGDWDEYCALYYLNNDAAKMEAMENLLWSLRRYNAFSCRLIFALPQVVNRSIEFLVLPSRTSTSSVQRLSLASQQAANLQRLYLATYESPNDKGDGNERLFHVVPLRPTSEVDLDSLPVAEVSHDALFFGAYDRFGGGESDLPPIKNEERTAEKKQFDWQLYEQTLKNAKVTLGTKRVAQAEAEAEAQVEVDSTVPMSIYGCNTRVMRIEYERLQKLFEKDAQAKANLGAMAEHLRRETERLERIFGQSTEADKLAKERDTAGATASLITMKQSVKAETESNIDLPTQPLDELERWLYQQDFSATHAAQMYLDNCLEADQGQIELNQFVSDAHFCVAQKSAKSYLISCTQEAIFANEIGASLQDSFNTRKIAEHKHDFVGSICYIDQIGVVLLCDELASAEPSAGRKQQGLLCMEKLDYESSIKRKLRVFDWNSGEMTHNAEVILDNYSSVVLPSVKHRILLVDNYNKAATEIDLPDSSTSSETGGTLVVTRHVVIPWQDTFLPTLNLDVQTSHAVVAKGQKAVVYTFDDDFLVRAEIQFPKTQEVRCSFISCKGFCLFFMSDLSVRSSLTQVLLVFNFDGVQLSFFGAEESLPTLPINACDFFSQCESANTSELTLVYFEKKFRQQNSFQFLRFRDKKTPLKFDCAALETSCSNDYFPAGFAETLIGFISANRSSEEKNALANQQLEKARPKTIAFGESESDLLKPELISCVRMRDTLYVIDAANAVLKRIDGFSRSHTSQSECDATVIWMSNSQSADRLTGLCVLDERTLVIVQGYCQLTFLRVETRSRTRKLYSLRLRDDALKVDVSGKPAVFIFAVDRKRIVLAIEGAESIFEVSASSNSSDWRIVKAVKTEKVRCLTFSKAKRLFTLATNGKILLLDVELKEAFKVDVLDIFKLGLVTSVQFLRNQCLVLLPSSYKCYDLFSLPYYSDKVTYKCSIDCFFGYFLGFFEVSEAKMMFLDRNEVKEISFARFSSAASSISSGYPESMEIFSTAEGDEQ